MKEKKSIKLIYFDNGLVTTNILLNVMNDETPKEAFEKMIKEDDLFEKHNCYDKCKYVGYEELKGDF
jgi:hypothetical protein